MLINQLYYPEGSSCLHLFSCPDLVLLEGGVWGEHIERWPHHSSLNLFIYWLCVLPSQQLDLGNLGLTPVTYWLCDHGLSFLTSKMKELDLSTPEILILLFTWWLSSSLGGALRKDNLFWNITFLSPIFKEEVSLNPFQIQRNGEILDHFSIN